MANRLDHPLAVYPMVEESEAVGRVAAVYGSILETMPFVPSLFKSLAVCPDYLGLAWDQSSRAQDNADFSTAAQRLASLAAEAGEPPNDPAVAQALARFVEPLSRLLLVGAGLERALAGAIAGPPARDAVTSRAGPVEPAEPVPAASKVGELEVYGDIRRALDTPIVNSVWRSLAEQHLLRAAWDELSRRVEASRSTAGALQAEALDSAVRLRWEVVAGPEALDEAGIGDVAPGMASILDAYVKTLPRVLALVAPSAPR